MVEQISVKKTGKSKFGFYLMDEDSKFSGVTEQVSNFLKNQVPCEIEVEAKEGEGKATKISRVKVLSKVQDNSANEFEGPVETERPGELPTANEYQDDRQNSIESQMCIYAAIEMIKANNECNEFEKIKPVQNNISDTAKIVKDILKEVKKY
jgi:hypothetical protein